PSEPKFAHFRRLSNNLPVLLVWWAARCGFLPGDADKEGHLFCAHSFRRKISADGKSASPLEDSRVAAWCSGWPALGNSDVDGHAYGFRSALADFVSGNSIRPRLRVPRQLLDGSSRPMETRSHLSSMGRSGSLRIRRGPLHFLSASIVDAGSHARSVPTMENSSRGVPVDRANPLRLLHVSAHAQVPGAARRHFCRRTLRR